MICAINHWPQSAVKAGDTDRDRRLGSSVAISSPTSGKSSTSLRKGHGRRRPQTALAIAPWCARSSNAWGRRSSRSPCIWPATPSSLNGACPSESHFRKVFPVVRANSSRSRSRPASVVTPNCRICWSSGFSRDAASSGFRCKRVGPASRAGPVPSQISGVRSAPEHTDNLVLHLQPEEPGNAA